MSSGHGYGGGGQGEGGEVAIPAYEAIRQNESLGHRMLEILLRGVSTRKYCSVLPEMAETVGVSRSSAAIAVELEEVRREYEQTGKAARVFKGFEYQTRESWSRARRVVAKAEHLEKGSNPRFVVTSLSAERWEARRLYEQRYCARGEMEKARCRKIFREKVSGAGRKRPELIRLLDQLREGDIVVVSKRDRLARSTPGLLEIVESIRSAGARLQSLGEPWADTTSYAGKMIMTVFAGIAELERDLIRERAGAGPEAAKRSGVRFGRPKKLNAKQEKLAWRLLKGGSSIKRRSPRPSGSIRPRFIDSQTREPR